MNEWRTYINGAKNSTFTVVTDDDDDDGDSAGDVGNDDDDDDDDDDHNDNDDDNHHNLTLDQKSFSFLSIANFFSVLGFLGCPVTIYALQCGFVFVMLFFRKNQTKTKKYIIITRNTSIAGPRRALRGNDKK